MTGLWPLILIPLALLSWALLCRWLLDNPRGDVPLGLAFHTVRFYSFWFHRLRIRGVENVPNRKCGPLIVVCNHTAGVDPALVQAACPFEVRWMMAKDMMLPRYQWLWDWVRVIGVDRTTKRDTASAREAIRHLEALGVVGVFPEGGIESPPRTLRPFMAGVGLLVAKTDSPVMPVFIEGTPNTPRAWGSLWIRSHARLTIGPPMYFAQGAKADAIAAEIQHWFERTSGWPVAPASPLPLATLAPAQESPRRLTA